MNKKKTSASVTSKRQSVEDVKKKFPRKVKTMTTISEKPYIGPNDIGWRTEDATMAKLVGNLPFGLAAGVPQQFNVEEDLANTPISGSWRQPGILSIITKLTLGSISSLGGQAYNAAINMAGRKAFSWIRHANSGSRNYENVDLTLYFGAIGQVLGLLGWLQRVRRLVGEYSTTNRYLPAALLRIMGCDIVDLQNHQPQLSYLIAWLGRAVGSLAFPDLPYFHACYEAYKYVIRDNESPKEQFYVLNSGGFAVYNPTFNSNGGGLQYTGSVPWNNGSVATLMTFSTIQAYVRERMDVLLSDEDCGIISGDILKAYASEGKLFKVEAFPEGYDVFIKSEEILQQIHNCNIVRPDHGALAHYEQAVGGANQAPYLVMGWSTGTPFSASVGVSDKLIIDAFSAEPDEKEVINCTVLNPQARITNLGGSVGYAVGPYDVHFDLHLPEEILVISDLSGSPILASDYFVRYTVYFTYTFNLPSVTNFDWHPLAVKGHVQSDGSYIVDVVGDIQNFRVFDGEVGQRIHDNSMLSLLGFQGHNFY